MAGGGRPGPQCSHNLGAVPTYQPDPGERRHKQTLQLELNFNFHILNEL